MVDQLERACRAAAEALHGKMEDADWQARWQWHHTEARRRGGGEWDVITIIKAAAPILRQVDPGDSPEMVERMLHAWTAAQSGPIDERIWKLSYSPTSAPARAMRAVLEAIREPTEMMAAEPIHRGTGIHPHTARVAWTTMIDAALAPLAPATPPTPPDQ